MAEPIIAPPAPTQAPAAPTSAELTTRAAEIKKRGAEIKASRAAIANEQAQLERDKAEVHAAKAEIKRIKDLHSSATIDPSKFLTGIYGEQFADVLARYQTGDKTPLELAQLRQELAAVKAREEERNKPPEVNPAAEQAKAAKAQEQEVEQQFQEYRAETVKRFATGGELAAQFPTLSSSGLGYAVADELRRMHLAGELSGTSDLAALELKIATEKEADLDKLLESVLAIPKWQAKVKPTPAVKKSDGPLPFQVKPKALSQQMQAGAAEPKKPLTRDQRRSMLAGLPDAEWNKRVDAARGLRIAADE